MKKHISERPYAEKVTKAALFVVDAIKRKRQPGLINDSQISLRLKCAKQTVHMWRSGERAITLDQLGELINQFDVHPVFLLKQQGSPWGDSEMIMKLKDIERNQQEMDLRLSAVENKLGIKSGTERPQKSRN